MWPYTWLYSVTPPKLVTSFCNLFSISAKISYLEYWHTLCDSLCDNFLLVTVSTNYFLRPKNSNCLLPESLCPKLRWCPLTMDWLSSGARDGISKSFVVVLASSSLCQMKKGVVVGGGRVVVGRPGSGGGCSGLAVELLDLYFFIDFFAPSDKQKNIVNKTVNAVCSLLLIKPKEEYKKMLLTPHSLINEHSVSRKSSYSSFHNYQMNQRCK